MQHTLYRMSRLIFLRIIYVPLFVLSCGLALAFDTVLVTRVIDGDTIELSTGEKVRYIGINTPEISRTDAITKQLGLKAKNFNESLVKGKTGRLEFDVQHKDKYGRLLAYVYVGDIFVNAELVRQGYAAASTYPPNVKYADLFKRLEQEARENKRGLW